MQKYAQFVLNEEDLADEAALYLHENAGDANKILHAFEVGVAVISRTEASSEMDFVKGKVEALMSHVQGVVDAAGRSYLEGIAKATGEKFDPALPGSYADRFGKFMNDKAATFVTELKAKAETISAEVRRVEENTSEKEGSAIARIKKTVADVERFVAEQFDPRNTSSYTYQLQQATALALSSLDASVSKTIGERIRAEMDAQLKPLTGALVEIREAIAKEEGKAEIMKITSAKGFTFEEELFERVQAIAAASGESVEDSGLTKEIGGSQKGDLLYTTSDKQLIVIEAKDKPVARKESLDYMKLALEARGSRFGILVARHADQLQKQIGRWQVYDNVIICCADDIEISVKIAKMKLALSSVAGEEVNAGVIATKLGAIVDEMKKFATMKTNLTNMKNATAVGAEKIGTLLDEVQAGISSAIESVTKELDKARAKEAA